jgi:UDP-N-acetylenolpyruvoylglucosamine reductase
LLCLEGTLKLTPGKESRVVKKKMEALTAGRREVQPLEYPNGGSVFSESGRVFRRRAY